MLKEHYWGCKTSISKGRKLLIRCQERNWLPVWFYPSGMFLHVGKGWSIPTTFFSSHSWALGLLSPFKWLQVVLRGRFTPPACVSWPCNVGLWAGRTHKLSRQKAPAQFLLPTLSPINTPYQVEEVIQPPSKILFFYLPNPRVLVRLMGCSVINTFCCRIHQGKGDTDPLG